MKLVLGLCVLIAVLVVAGCYDDEGLRDVKQPAIGLRVVEAEGCEYFLVKGYLCYTYTHKGNCKNPIHYCKCPVKKGK